MNHRALLTVFLIMAFIPQFGRAGTRDAQWQKVDDAMRKRLPRTAIEELQPIIDGALKDKAYGEAVKAIARRVALEAMIQGNRPDERITRMQAEISKAPPEIKPILDTIQAEWFGQYFQMNRWRFMQRAAIAQMQSARTPGNDFTTWDLPRILREIDRQFQNALSAADALKKIPVSAYNDLLEKGSLPDKYRPTLYDFIAHEALDFYTSGEQAGAKPEESFDVPAGSPIFDPADNFITWRPAITQTDSPAARAINLFQELMKFHSHDADPTALIDLDLARLIYGKNVAFGEEKNDRLKVALKLIADKWGDNELSAEALYQWAQLLHDEGNLVESRNVALRGTGAFRESVGGKQCRNLIASIETKSASITTERVWNPPLPKIGISYRNVTKVYFRAVAYDWAVFLEKTHSRPESLNDAERQELLAKTPTFAWSTDLPTTTDYKERVEELPAPDKLKPGFYFIIASHDPGFGEKDNQVTFTDVWVSDLALIVRPRNGQIEGFVLEALSGEPLKGAEVQTWFLNGNGNRVAEPVRTTDENGFFSFSSRRDRGYLIRVRHNGRELGSQQEYASYAYERQERSSQTIFFTDRAIYRPGQTVQYKGICLRVNPEADDYRLLRGQTVTVIFNDPNGKEIARQERQCNDYGSFSGSFIAPRDRLMGAMQIIVTKGPDGATSVQVEEYKRPKFQATLDPPKTAARLNDKASLQGHALAYTGAAVDGAQVAYRVERQVRYPIWWGYRWWRSPRRDESQEIAHGTATTEADGSFKIEFMAKPDISVPEKDEPTFVFAVHADVTDSAGETRSADKTVNIGYTALQASLTADDWETVDKPVELKIKTETLDGEGQTAEGSLKVYRLRQPDKPQRPPLVLREVRVDDLYIPVAEYPDSKGEKDLSSPNSWELGDVAVEKGFTTDAKGEMATSIQLPEGAYRATLETQDRFGKKVTALLPIRVLKPDAPRLAIRIPSLVAARSWTVEPGQAFTALWGTGYDEGRAFIEVEHRNRMISRYWTQPGRTQETIKQAITESMRGGFTVHVTQVRENRAYLESRHVDVPWSNKELSVKWEHFTSKLQPAQKETWTAVVTGPGAQKSVAEMVATLYDESLDAFAPFDWMRAFSFFYQDASTAHPSFENVPMSFGYLKSGWQRDTLQVEATYRSFPRELGVGYFRRGFLGRQIYASGGTVPYVTGTYFNGIGGIGVARAASATMPSTMQTASLATLSLANDAAKKEPEEARTGPPPPPAPKPAPDLSQVTARKNLQETAFFFPQLLSDTNGEVRMMFTMPEALTQWRFIGFAHDRQLRSGFLEGKTVTAKDLMVQPNPPRFLREGDILEFTVKVSNQTTNEQRGKVRLKFNEALNDQSADQQLGNSRPEQDFDIPAKESRSHSWRIKVPDGLGFLTYKAVASTGAVSDGEEGNVPVLSRRIFVTESLPLPIRGPATKKFEFTKLLQSGKSSTLRNQDLTVQMVSNPAWYAVLALPYLMEFPHECSEQTFNRFYANALARSIAMSDPKIRRVFDQWKNTPALDSPLEKNQDLKSVAIEETPWLRQAQSESQARKNVGILFDENRLNYETDATLSKLAQMQLPDGSWPWFPGGRGNDYITLYITTGFGRLRHLGVDINAGPAIRSLRRLDGWIAQEYRDILDHGHKEENNLNATVALYLYGRSFFLKDEPVAQPSREAVDYFLAQAKKYWVKLDNRQSEAHLAIALQRFGDASTPQDIMKSLKERSVSNDEMGMFWRDTELSWWWYRAPIETQALMIEAFDEVAHDAKAVEDCKVWLLKQKQTQDWKTTKATADAVYALLLKGNDLLTSDVLVSISLGGKEIKPEHVEAGTGFYEQKFTGLEIKSKLCEITVKKSDLGVAWGSVHWQYLEDMSKLTPYEGTPLHLKKSLFVKRNTSHGPELVAAKSFKVGDELVVRIELRTDRDMEYVHLKDQRGSGLEPVNVLSQYKYQDGLTYYESTRDTASHFFIDYLRKGVYVFEYSTRVVHRGEYQSGIAEIQCMYAPEFNSHSESLDLTVR
jgi:uncharacterized protein YfaS (alpha-2-macroglobulin family)